MLPISVGYQRSLPYTTEQMEYSREEAQKLAENHLQQYIGKLEEAQISVIGSEISTEITDTVCRTRGTLTVLEEAVERQVCEQRTVMPTPAPE